MRNGPLISGTGSALPKRVVENAEIEARLGVPPGWIQRRVGALRRHVVGDDEGCTQLAIAAAIAALEDAGLNGSDLDMVLVATTSPDHPMPSTAAAVAGAIGAVGGAVDVGAACAGFVYGLSLATGQIASGLAHRVLLVGVEVISRSIDWKDPVTCPIFGDGAGAVVLERSTRPERGVRAIVLGSDGVRGPLLHLEAGGVESLRHGHAAGDPFLRMDGRGIYRQATRRLKDAILEAMTRADWQVEQLDWLVPHQANARLLQTVARKVGLPAERVLMNIANRGNTSAASIPLLLDEAAKAGQLEPGQRVVLAGLGAGLVWGAVALRW